MDELEEVKSVKLPEIVNKSQIVESVKEQMG